jgi:hypothetical protein
VFNELRLYLKLRPDLNRIKELSRMKLSVNVVGQMLLTILHMGNLALGFVPAADKFYVTAALGFLQIVISVLAHYRNPDGSPASQPYGLTESDLAQYRRIFGGAAKIIIVVLVALAFAPRAIAQTPATPASAAAAVSNITYLPKWYGSVGVGGAIPGNSRFAYESISAYLGAATYATTVNQYTISNGKVQDCTLAGLTKALYQFRPLTIGTTGLGGGCSSTSGDSAAGAVQGFASLRIRKSPISLVATGEKTWIATGPGPNGGKQGVQLTLGISYGL